MNSSEERERFKEEYKAHYRQILESRKRIEEYKRKQRIADAVDKMNPGGILETMENMLQKIREKVAITEARLEIASEKEEELLSPEDEAIVEKYRAKETIQQIKLEMGLLQEEIDDQVKQLQTDKTVGRKESETDPDSGKPDFKSMKKTIGPAGKREN